MLVSWLTCALAHAQDASSSPRLRLFLPPNIASDKVKIEYVLYGSFGAYGNSAEAKADSSSVEIPLDVRGQVAEEIKAFAWVPGCRIGTFDLKVERLDIQSTYSCAPAPSVLLTGRIRKSDLPRLKETEIHVGYLPSWMCDFFQFADCMVFEIPIAIAKVDPNGCFEIELPDFASDSIVASARDLGYFEVTSRDVRTKNVVAALSPESKVLQTIGDKLKPASVYPNPTMFIGGKPQ